MVSDLSFTLPKPPSINHIYGYTSRGGFARSYITKKGKDWFLNSAKHLSTLGIKKTLECPIKVSICLYTCRQQDIDNINKPILDLLAICLVCFEKYSLRKDCICRKKKGVIIDDVQVYRLVVAKKKVKIKEEKITVSVSCL